MRPKYEKVLLKVGDVVRLISGGPLMTIANTRYIDDEGNNLIMCLWFADAKMFAKANLHTGYFNPACLVLQEVQSSDLNRD